MLDSSAAATLEGFVRQSVRRHTRIYFAGARAPVRLALQMHGIRQPPVRFVASLEAAVALAHANLPEIVTDGDEVAGQQPAA